MNKSKPRTDDETNAKAPGVGSGAEGTDYAKGGSEEPSNTEATTDDTEPPLQESLEERYEELEERYEQARDALEEYNRTAMDFIRENPGICIAGAIGAGYIVGRLASRRWLK